MTTTLTMQAPSTCKYCGQPCPHTSLYRAGCYLCAATKTHIATLESRLDAAQRTLAVRAMMGLDETPPPPRARSQGERERRRRYRARQSMRRQAARKRDMLEQLVLDGAVFWVRSDLILPMVPPIEMAVEFESFADGLREETGICVH